MFQADELLLALRDAHVRFAVVGGITVVREARRRV